MDESKLIKDWKNSDVQRMRNLITGKLKDSTKTQVGYKKKDTVHVENEIWEENGKTWTIKNGIKQTVSKLDGFRKMDSLPLTCPKCQKPLKNHKLNRTMYSVHKMCADCVISMETELKREGKFEEYQKQINKRGMEYHLKEAEAVLLELSLASSEESFVTEGGDIESWKGNDEVRQRLIKDIQEYINKLKVAIEQ
jgi:hypothetical protein